jgi:hypothetical protein
MTLRRLRERVPFRMPAPAAVAAPDPLSSLPPGSSTTTTTTAADPGVPLPQASMLVPAVPATPLPPARTAPGVAVAVGGGFAASLATTMQYLGPWNWPLPRPDDLQALNLAGFLITVGATLFHLWANRDAVAPVLSASGSASTSTSTTTVTEPAGSSPAPPSAAMGVLSRMFRGPN